MATTEALHPGDMFPLHATPASGSELYKLVKLRNDGAMYAPTDLEVARIEASFMGPDLHDSEKALLQISGNEEEERKALLERMQAYDLKLSRIETQQQQQQQSAKEATPQMTSSEVFTATTTGEANLTIDCDAQVTSQGYEALDSTGRKSTEDLSQQDVGGFCAGDYLDVVGEDDEEEDEDDDLLCDFAPGALQADGSMGLMDSEGTHVLAPPSPTSAAADDDVLTPRSTSSWKMPRGPTAAQRRAMMMGRRPQLAALAARGPRQPTAAATEEPCLSDSWHASDSSDGSIVALRRQYHRVFSKETSSNNRQWLLRRLAEINSYGDELDGAMEAEAMGAGAHAHAGEGYHSGDHSGNGSGGGSDLEDGNSPLYSAVGGGAHVGDFFGMGDSDHAEVAGMKGRYRHGVAAAHGLQSPRGAVAGAGAMPMGRGSGKRLVKPNRHFNDGLNDGHGGGDEGKGVHGRHASKLHKQEQRRMGSHHSKRSRDTDSHNSAEGGSKSAKTDGSAASLAAGKKKYKKGHHSDSDDLSAGEEPPVKSRNNSHRAQQQEQQHRKPAPSRKMLAQEAAGAGSAGEGGANGRRSKHHNPWALEEAEALVEGVARCGGGKWADIKKLGFAAIEHRTAVDLKDKWRNLLRIAMLPHQPVKNAGDKKREIPLGLLARVRELAAKQAKKAQAQDGRSRGIGRSSS